MINFKDSVVSLDDSSTLRVDGSIRCGAGVLTILYGTNGAGKSILLNSLASGFGHAELSILESTSTLDAPAELGKSGIAFMNQVPIENFVSRCSADEFILPLVSESKTLDEIVEALRDLLSDWPATRTRMTIGRHINTLSSGELQTFAFMANLAASPSLLLLDEPFSRYDPASLSAALELLDRHSAHMAVVITTHCPHAVCDLVKNRDSVAIHKVTRDADRITVQEVDQASLKTNESALADCVARISPSLGAALEQYRSPPTTAKLLHDPRAQIVMQFQGGVCIHSKRAGVLIDTSDATLHEGLNICYGANGSGKSLLLETFAGLLPINPKVRFRRDRWATTRDVTGTFSPATLRRRGKSVLLPPDPDDWISESTASAEFTLFNHSEASLPQPLRELGISPDSQTASLSFGQRKLLALFALPKQCDLVLLDEPFADLSGATVQVVVDLIQERLNSEHWNTVVVSMNNVRSHVG